MLIPKHCLLSCLSDFVFSFATHYISTIYKGFFFEICYTMYHKCYILYHDLRGNCYILYHSFATFFVICSFLCIFVADRQKNNPKQTEKTMNKTDNRMVIQSYLITTARYDFTIDQKRVLTRIIELLQPLLEGKVLRGRVEQDLWGDYRFTLPSGFFVGDDTNYTRTKKALKSLRDITFECCTEKNDWEYIGLIEKPKITKKGEIIFEVSEELVNIFLDFSKGYSKYILGISLGFSSVYSMRLYELLSGQNKPIKFKIDKLKDIWCLSKSYQRNFNFIQRIIEPAKKELYEKSNWIFTYELQKKGNKFEYITFFPKHIPERETTELKEAESLREIDLRYILDRNVTEYLIHTCGFTSTELNHNKVTIEKFVRKYRSNTDQAIRDIWGRARAYGKDPKSYFFGALKNETK